MSLKRRASEPYTSSDNRLRHDRPLAVGVFFVVLAVYLLTYSGIFKSNDERALFSGTDSFVKRGAFTVGQIYWDYTHVGMLTSTGEMVPNYEPAPMILAIPFYLWGRALSAGVQGVMLMGAAIGAAAAALVFLCVLELGYSRRTAAFTAFVFAFATQAWPYSRSVYREPQTLLAYLLALYALLRYRPPSPRRLLWPALFGAALGLAYTTKYISIAVLPGLLPLAFLYELRRPGTQRDHLNAALAALVPVAAFLVLNQVYKDATLRDVTTFARDIVEYTTNPQLSTSQLTRMVRATLGLTISPYKGVLWFAPVLLLGIAGACSFVRRHRWEGWAFIVIIVAHVAGYSRYLYWSGGVTWGTRYLLLIVPFLVLMAVPVFAWLLRDPLVPGQPRAAGEAPGLDPTIPGRDQRGNAGAGEGAGQSSHAIATVLRWLGSLAVVALIALSVAIQVLGVAIDFTVYELDFLLTQAKVWGGVGEAIDALYMVPRYSPVFGHLRLLLAGKQPLDFAWVQLRPGGHWALVPAGLIASLAAIAVAVVAFAWIWRRPRHAAALGGALGIATLGLCSGLLLVYRQGDARFDKNDVDRFLRPMMAALDQSVVPAGAAPEPASGQHPALCCRTGVVGVQACTGVLVVPDSTLTDYFLNYLAAPLPWYDSIESNATAKDRANQQTLLNQLADRYTDIWLARDRSAATDDKEGRRDAERYLTDRAYKIDEQQFGDWARLLHYSAAGDLAETARPGQGLGELSLDEVTLRLARSGPPAACTGSQAPRPAQPSNDGSVQAQTGDTLQIGLHWRAQEKPAANYTVFVQLLDAGSQVKAQRDRWPGDGLYPTAGLAAGQTITDNLALRLDVPPGPYRLIAGLYRNDVEGYPRLSGPGGDTVTLARVDVK